MARKRAMSRVRIGSALLELAMHGVRARLAGERLTIAMTRDRPRIMRPRSTTGWDASARLVEVRTPPHRTIAIAVSRRVARTVLHNRRTLPIQNLLRAKLCCYLVMRGATPRCPQGRASRSRALAGLARSGVFFCNQRPPRTTAICVKGSSPQVVRSTAADRTPSTAGGAPGGAVDPRTMSSGRKRYSSLGAPSPRISSTTARTAATDIDWTGCWIVVSAGAVNAMIGESS